MRHPESLTAEMAYLQSRTTVFANSLDPSLVIETYPDTFSPDSTKSFLMVNLTSDREGLIVVATKLSSNDESTEEPGDTLLIYREADVVEVSRTAGISPPERTIESLRSGLLMVWAFNFDSNLDRASMKPYTAPNGKPVRQIKFDYNSDLRYLNGRISGIADENGLIALPGYREILSGLSSPIYT